MPRSKGHNWRRARGWHSHSIACWDSEWAEWKRAAELQGKSVNGWIRDGLKEIVRYERLAQREPDFIGMAGELDSAPSGGDRPQ